MKDAQSDERVCLSENETIVPRGHRKVVWFVRDGERWRPAATWPGATVDNQDPGPGTVWTRQVSLELRTGTTLMRVDSQPADQQPRDVLDYLRRETRLAERRAHRGYYRVASGGELHRLPEDGTSNGRRPRT